MNQRDIWRSLLGNRWRIKNIKESNCLNENQVAEVIYETGKEHKLRYDVSTSVPEEDLAFGIQLYAAIHSCPDHLVEAAKIFHFFETLISNKTLNTVVAATMQNIQPNADENIKDFTAVNIWYERLDERYNFSLGPVVLPLLTSDSLERLKSLDPPYLKDLEAKINGDNNMSALFGNEFDI